MRTVTPAQLRPTLGRILLAGVAAGAASALLAVPLAWLLQRAVGSRFAELAPAHLTQACVVSALVGAIAYDALVRRAPRPAGAFTVVAFAVAVLYSLVVALNPPQPGFAAVAAPLHLLVAAVTALLLPMLAPSAHPPADQPQPRKARR